MALLWEDDLGKEPEILWTLRSNALACTTLVRLARVARTYCGIIDIFSYLDMEVRTEAAGTATLTTLSRGALKPITTSRLMLWQLSGLSPVAYAFAAGALAALFNLAGNALAHI